MLETLNMINTLTERGIQVVFVRQPELSTVGPHHHLLLAIYSYFAQAEREYIALRTKQGLAVAKAKGKRLGRPKGSKNTKGRALDPYRQQIKRYLKFHLSLNAIRKIINDQRDKPLSYSSYVFFVPRDDQLK